MFVSRVGDQVRALSSADRETVLELCAVDPAANVYVAARVREHDLDRHRGNLLGYYEEGMLRSVCWASANVVPVESTPAAAHAFAGRLRRHHYHCSSIFGPSRQVAELWSILAGMWPRPMEVRRRQPLMAITAGATLAAARDLRVRRALPSELDLVAPAAAAMFTEEIGYPPFRERSGRSAYLGTIRGLIARGHCFVIVEDGRVIFKADVGSVALDTCQIQGVWVTPDLRGRGLAAPAMAATIAMIRRDIAPTVTLYVNEYNASALATYYRVGFRQVGEFSTVLL